MLCWYYYNIVERNKQSVKKKLRIENINEKIGRASTEKVGEAEKIYIGEADTDTFHFSLLSGKAAKAQQIKEKREEIKEKSTKRKTALSAAFLFGGAYGIRTRDLHTASVARFQLR